MATLVARQDGFQTKIANIHHLLFMQAAQHSTFQSAILEELLLLCAGVGAPVMTGTGFPFASAGPAPQIIGFQAFGLQFYRPIYIIDDHHFVMP